MSTRSNEGRIGANPNLPAENELSETTELKFITPTEFVELPSKGRFYDVSHPLHNQDVVEIKHMTTKEEDILSSVTLLKKGLALDRMLSNILVDKRVKVDDLFLGDKNALIIAARAHGYGPSYDTAIVCPLCKGSQDYSFDLNSLKTQFPAEELLEKYKAKITEQGTLLLPLPKINHQMELRLLSSGDEKRISETQEANRKKRDFVESSVSDFLNCVVVAVDGITDRRQLRGFVETLPALQVRYIRKVYNILAPELDLSHEFRCAECDYEGAMEVPLTADFFWPNA